MVRVPAGADGEGQIAAYLRAPAREAALVHVTGVVQGVGFRPFVRRLALRHGLAGWVLNSAGDVQMLVEGSPDGVNAFVDAIRPEAPPLARIEGLVRTLGVALGLETFTIRRSREELNRR